MSTSAIVSVCELNTIADKVSAVGATSARREIERNRTFVYHEFPGDAPYKVHALRGMLVVEKCSPQAFNFGWGVNVSFEQGASFPKNFISIPGGQKKSLFFLNHTSCDRFVWQRSTSFNMEIYRLGKRASIGGQQGEIKK